MYQPTKCRSLGSKTRAFEDAEIGENRMAKALYIGSSGDLHQLPQAERKETNLMVVFSARA